MIRPIRDKELKRLFERGAPSGVNPEHAGKLRDILAALHAPSVARMYMRYGLYMTALLLAGGPVAAQSSPSNACQPFPSNVLYLEDENPNIGLGDFNSDGILDMVALTPQGVNVLIGKGDGTFRIAGTFPAGRLSAYSQITVGDFNHDGKLDVALADEGGRLEVLLGNGDGTFQMRVSSPIQSYTGFLATGDFNADGNLDLVAVPADQGAPFVVQVLLGNGDGTFQAPVNYAVGPYPRQVAVADFNGDGKLDVAVANAGIMAEPGHTVSVLLGNGDGTFQAKTDFQVGNQPFGITAGDLNGDGTVDLATANYLDGTVSVLFGEGNGAFRPAGTYPAGHPYAPYAIAAVSFESGEEPGLAVATVAGTFILANKGDGTFRAAQGYDPGSIQVLAGDFNGDGKTDLAIGAGLSDTDSGVAVLLGAGHGVFATSTAYTALPNVSTVAVGDFNQDGRPDLVVADLDSPYYLGIMLGQKDGRFAEPAQLYDLSSSPFDIAVGDLNGDGKLDLVVAIQKITGDLQYLVSGQVLLGNGDGTFTAGQSVKLLGRWPDWISLADFNGDGKLDIAAVSTGDYESHGALSVLLGNGDGTFQPAVGYAMDNEGTSLAGLVIGDFNRDGKPDIAVADNLKGELRVFLGNGDGSFHDGPQTPLAAFVSGLAAADFNQDGKLDIAANMETPGIQILTGNGDGSFTAGDSFPAFYGDWITAADLNGDQHADLAVLSGEGLLQLFLGKGDGTFSAGVTTYTGTDPGERNLALVDLNPDQAPSLVAPNYDGGSVSIFVNRCAARRAAP